ncbi:MAG: alpha-E domain-containing protein, partial [Acidobacteriota bacterium]|nr:alpha-E domain-containing protein [Acidobacteriota bacterium]
MMLSRIADSLFWVGRYMERADNTARILDVNYHMLLEQPADTYKLRWDPLIAITGERSRFYERYEEADARNAFEFLGFSEDNPNSISQCIVSARENARAIRDRLSRELWEDINSLYHKVNTLRESDEDLSRFCDAVKRGGHRFHGVCEATQPRDEGWHFLQAGCALERAEMTARILDVHYHQMLEAPEILNESRSHTWMAVLKSVAAYEFYKRQYSQIEPEKVAELLLLDARHPRCVRFSLGVLQE